MQRGLIYRKGDSWMLQYWQPVIENGKQTKRRIARKIGTIREYRTLTQVRPQAELILAPINAKTAPPRATDKVVDFLERKYMPHCEETKRPSTYKGYAQMFDLLKPHFGDIQLAAFTTWDADNVLKDATKKKQRAHTTHRNMKSFLSGAFTYAIRQKLLTHNPVSACEIPRGKSARERDAYTLDEITAMLKVLGEPARTVVLVAGLTGLRRSELQGLKWEDVEEDRLTVRRAVWQGAETETKTLASNAHVPLVPFVKEALAAHRKRTPDGYVFQAGNGSALRTENLFQREMQAPLQAAGIKWRGWHPFRHGVGSTLHAFGTPIKVISEILRHAETKVTMDLYVKPSAAAQREAMDKMEAALGEAMSRAEQA